MKKTITCIACPLGCDLVVEYAEGSDAVTVTGNKCERGEVYATEEILAPKRTVTATVSLLGGELPRLPVRTNASIKKELIPDLLNELYGLTVQAPVGAGDTILLNFRGSGIDVIATRRFPSPCRVDTGPARHSP